MYSFVGNYFVALAVAMVSMFALTLLWVSISENWASYKAAKRMGAADRQVPADTRVAPR